MFTDCSLHIRIHCYRMAGVVLQVVDTAIPFDVDQTRHTYFARLTSEIALLTRCCLCEVNIRFLSQIQHRLKHLAVFLNIPKLTWIIYVFFERVGESKRLFHYAMFS